MPSKNTVKKYYPDAFYHIYNRGYNRQLIFHDEADYRVFLSLLKRYLSKAGKDLRERDYPSYEGEVDLLAYCLMPNHFHLLVYQGEDSHMITQFMRSLVTSYSMYFNKKYKRVGHLFQGIYKASSIEDQPYLEHISRYIHLNPETWETYEWSSYSYYLGIKKASWLKPEKIMNNYGSAKDYVKFMKDYDKAKLENDDIG